GGGFPAAHQRRPPAGQAGRRGQRSRHPRSTGGAKILSCASRPHRDRRGGRPHAGPDHCHGKQGRAARGRVVFRPKRATSDSHMPRGKMKRYLARLLAAAAIAGPILAVLMTTARAEDIQTSAQTVYIVDYQTGSVLLDKN